MATVGAADTEEQDMFAETFEADRNPPPVLGAAGSFESGLPR
jgi:hypothetical protein